MQNCLKHLFEKYLQTAVTAILILEDILEVAVCRGSTKSASTGVPFQ